MIKSNRSALGRRSKNKGNNYERTLAKRFKEVYEVDLVRTPQSGGFVKRSTEATDFRGDIVPVEAGVELLLHIEAKNQKILAPRKWIEQAKSDCPESKIPIVVFHEHGTSNDYVLLENDHLKNLIYLDGCYARIYPTKNWSLIPCHQLTSMECPSDLLPVSLFISSDTYYALISLKDFLSAVPKELVFRRVQ